MNKHFVILKKDGLSLAKARQPPLSWAPTTTVLAKMGMQLVLL